jgi:hypothetical protein
MRFKGVNMLGRVVTYITVSALMISCSTLPPKVQAMDVYYLKMRVPDGCEKLGDLEVTATSNLNDFTAEGMAKDKLQQKAYDEYKANTLHIKDVGNYFGGIDHTAYAEGTAYQCP